MRRPGRKFAQSLDAPPDGRARPGPGPGEHGPGPAARGYHRVPPGLGSPRGRGGPPGGMVLAGEPDVGGGEGQEDEGEDAERDEVDHGVTCGFGSVPAILRHAWYSGSAPSSRSAS